MHKGGLGPCTLAGGYANVSGVLVECSVNQRSVEKSGKAKAKAAKAAKAAKGAKGAKGGSDEAEEGSEGGGKGVEGEEMASVLSGNLAAAHLLNEEHVIPHGLVFTGHRSPDTDSVMAAVAAAHLWYVLYTSNMGCLEVLMEIGRAHD